MIAIAGMQPVSLASAAAMVAPGAAAVSQVHNKRVELLAGWLDRASTAGFTIGVLAPMAGYLYGASPSITVGHLLALCLAWLAAAITLHLAARFALGRLKK